jgi:hypothetical protein
MNKQEILFKLSDTADRLESAGLLREAIVLTNVMKRMADVVQPWDEEEPDYYYAIQGYAENVGKNNQLAQSIYDEYVKDMTDLINIQNNPNKRDLEKRLQAFKLQVEKLNSEHKSRPGTDKMQGIRNDILAQHINYFGLERATDLKDFNRRWKLYMDFGMKRARFDSSPNGKPIYYLPGMKQYFANLYEQLKLKYIK